MQTGPGIYVEILIQAELDKVWQLTQQPDLHQRWDPRFTRINYLPRPDPELSQYFLYETRIGFGLSINGTGESVGRRAANDGDTTSALRFASNDPKSLIRKGSGYWRYVPAERGLRFFTWYDYQVGASNRRWGKLFGYSGRFQVEEKSGSTPPIEILPKRTESRT